MTSEVLEVLQDWDLPDITAGPPLPDGVVLMLWDHWRDYVFGNPVLKPDRYFVRQFRTWADYHPEPNNLGREELLLLREYRRQEDRQYDPR